MQQVVRRQSICARPAGVARALIARAARAEHSVLLNGRPRANLHVFDSSFHRQRLPPTSLSGAKAAFLPMLLSSAGDKENRLCPAPNRVDRGLERPATGHARPASSPFMQRPLSHHRPHETNIGWRSDNLRVSSTCTGTMSATPAIAKPAKGISPSIGS
jgi:hypothetical protein